MSYSNLRSTQYLRSRGVVFVLLMAGALLALLLIPQLLSIASASPGNSHEMNSTILGIVRDDLLEAKRAKLPQGHFSDVNGCTCHRELLNQWNDSMHAKALTDEFFRYEYEIIQKEEGQKAADFCLACHAPGDMLTGGTGEKNAPKGVNGLVCTVCHQIAGQTVENSKIGNASFGYSPKAPDGVLRAQLENPKGAPHETMLEPYYNNSEFCGNCHQIRLPHNDFVIDNTYQEWATSKFAAEGKNCQNCHMFRDAKNLQAPYSGEATSMGTTRDNIFGMTFVGGNLEQSNAKLVQALLESAAKLELSYDGPDILKAGDEAKLKVTVTNVGAGHSIPGGITGLSQMWLTASSVDVNGENKQEIASFDFSPKLLDDKGTVLGVEFHKAAAISDDNRIAPGDSKEFEYSFVMPEGADNSYFLAELNYKTARDDVIAPSGVKNPSTVMASAEQGFFASAEAKASAEEIRSKQDKQDELGGLILDEKSTGIPEWLLFVLIGVAALILIAVIVIVVLRARSRKSYVPRHSGNRNNGEN